MHICLYPHSILCLKHFSSFYKCLFKACLFHGIFVIIHTHTCKFMAINRTVRKSTIPIPQNKCRCIVKAFLLTENYITSKQGITANLKLNNEPENNKNKGFVDLNDSFQSEA
jgi:hypothetical protein